MDIKPISYKDVDELLEKYVNVKFKLVRRRPRKVFYSSELRKKMVNEPYFNVLKKVEKKFKNGDDITPHLSRTVLNLDEPDWLLNDWNIRHLHLSDKKDDPNDTFYSRSDHLLFFYLHFPPKDDYVYFIDVRPHIESHPSHPNYPLWVRDELLEIIQKNWPQLLKPYEFKTIINSVPKRDRKERKKLREAGIISSPVIGGKVYCPPGGGVTTKGTGIIQRMYVDGILKRIYDWKNKFPKSSLKKHSEYGLICTTKKKKILAALTEEFAWIFL